MSSLPERLFLRLHDETAPGPESALPAGSLQAHGVPAALRPWVQGVLIYREHIASPLQERIIPDGAMRLVLPLDGGEALLLGADTRPALLPLRGHIEGLSLTLQAGAAQALAGLPAAALRDAALPLDRLWHGEASRLQQQLRDAHSDAIRLHRLHLALARRLAGAPTPGPTAQVQALLARLSGERRPVRALAARSGYSERRLQQLFQTELGIAPKTLSRLLRLHACLRQLRQPQDREAPDWAPLAAAQGFADQAHLVHEFRRFTGLSPRAYRERLRGIAGFCKTGGG